MKEVTFTVLGEPKGKGRPRFARRGNFVSSYTPKETLNYEAFIKMCYIDAAKGEVFEGPVEAEINCHFGIPRSVSKKKHKQMADGEVPCLKKCDLDNIAKSVLDAVNTIAYKDDSQIVKLVATKRYGETPRIDVTLREVEMCSL